MLDPLQKYTLALDSGDFKAIAAIWEEIYKGRYPGLEEAIMGLHGRIDDHEDITPQLEAMREEHR